MNEINRLRRITEIQKRAMDRWCPCSDHRDKTPPKYCSVCEIETIRNKTLEEAAKVADDEMLESRIAVPLADAAWDKCARKIAAAIRDMKR